MEQKPTLIACPYCLSKLVDEGKGYLECPKCLPNKKYPVVGKIYSFLNSAEKDLDLSIAKWGNYYANLDGQNIKEQLQKYITEDFPYVFPQLTENTPLDKNTVFLEIGCGPMFLASQIAPKVKLVVGIDFSLEALTLAQKLLEQEGIENYLLIHGDIKYMPLADSCVDSIYGGGVLEHFKDTSKAVSEMYRVLKNGGKAFNTVPYLNLGSLTYRQMWGNIPNMPILKQLAELIHIKIMKSRYMKFGYELSFTAPDLMKLHKRAGFRKTAVNHFKTRLVFEYVKNPTIRNIIIWMAENLSIFWPMVKVEAEK
jgi:ubiquinone/menaquinone biosynthesis C-methylase UbiE